jgi:hypothetical protein
MRFRLLLTFLSVSLLSSLVFAAPPLPESTPTGILADRVLPLAHLADLDGSSDAHAAPLARWRQALHELRRAAEKDLGWPTPRSIQAQALDQSAPHEIPLALIHARYDRLDGPDKIAAAEVLTLAALRENVYAGAQAEFSLDSARIFTNQSAKFVRLIVDPDDGAGPRNLTLGAPFQAHYATTGLKTLTLTAELADGRTLTARAVLNVKRLVTPEPTETWPITASVQYLGKAGSGQAYLYLAAGHATLTNPAIVVEGFDLDNSMDWPVLYDLLNQENMLEDLRTAGFDAVVLDFTEATEPIQRNAFVLTELLAQVNATIAAGKTSALVGASMGGLVSRYALAWLEDQGLDHRVRTYLSFDSPHGGANIPLGLQHWLEFFGDESDEALFLLGRLNTGAAQQMLLYHHLATSGTTARPHPSRATWLADMTALGEWPAQLRKVAVANGSGTMQNQGFAPGAQIVLYEYRSFLADVDGDVWAVPDGGPARIILDAGINLIWPLPDTELTVNIGGTLPWDGAPGGHRDSMAQMAAVQAPYGDILALHDNHCFVPTVSALALAGVTPFHDIAGDADLMSRTAFDQVYYPLANQGHVTLTPESKAWFVSEIQAGVSAVEDLPGRAARDVALLPAAPNPFNPRTKIRFRLATPAQVSVSLYDLAGRRVRTLTSGRRWDAGSHALTWEGRDDRGQAVASGVYFTRLQAGAEVRTGRVVLAK